MKLLITLFLCGDVMTGRGIDQALPRSAPPELRESYMKSARGYVELAREASGPFELPMQPGDVWGDALAELDRVNPVLRLINLETSITTNDDCWPGKGIHYRMHPANVACLTAARIDGCVLANNHVLDFGYPGLTETIATLEANGLRADAAGWLRDMLNQQGARFGVRVTLQTDGSLAAQWDR